jgi:integrase
MKIPKARQLQSGSWFIQLRIDGQSIPVTESTEDRCEARAYSIKSGLIKARPKSTNIALKDACNKYIETMRSRLSPSTVQGYEKIRDNAFPRLMEKPLSSITNKILNDAIGEECSRISPRTGKKYASKTIINNYLFVAAVLNVYAPDLIKRVSLPELKDKPIAILTAEEVYKAVKGSSVELPVLLSMWLSLSMSEIRGLTKSKSISQDKKQISVVETVVDIDGKPVRKEGGKEEKRSRTLALPAYLSKLIADVDGDIIVPMTAQTISKRFYSLLNKAGLPHINFHKLRHINASVMAMLQVPEPVANARGGWKTDYTRKRVYTHTFSEERKAADSKIDAYFSNIIKQKSATKKKPKKKPSSAKISKTR